MTLHDFLENNKAEGLRLISQWSQEVFDNLMQQALMAKIQGHNLDYLDKNTVIARHSNSPESTLIDPIFNEPMVEGTENLMRPFGSPETAEKSSLLSRVIDWLFPQKTSSIIVEKLTIAAEKTGFGFPLGGEKKGKETIQKAFPNINTGIFPND